MQHHLLSFHPHQLPSGHGLNGGEDLRQTGVPHVLQLTQQTRLEKHLGWTEKITELFCFILISFQASTLTGAVQSLCCTLVCPNLYWVWSMSREHSSFSTAFLLSTNEASGIAAGFKMRYLRNQSTHGLLRSTHQISVTSETSASVWHRPLFELRVQDAVWKALPANPDALKDSVTPQLMEDQERIHHTWKTHQGTLETSSTMF